MFASAGIGLEREMNAKARYSKGLSAVVLVGFVVGSIASGLATARFISQPEWLRE